MQNVSTIRPGALDIAILGAAVFTFGWMSVQHRRFIQDFCGKKEYSRAVEFGFRFLFLLFFVGPLLQLISEARGIDASFPWLRFAIVQTLCVLIVILGINYLEWMREMYKRKGWIK